MPVASGTRVPSSLVVVNIDPEKLLVVFVIALIVLGPSRLPQAARSLGRGLAEVRRYTAVFRSEVDQVLAEPRAIIQSAVHEAEMLTGRPTGHEGAAGGEVAEAFSGRDGAAVEPEASASVPWTGSPGVPAGAPDDPSFN